MIPIQITNNKIHNNINMKPKFKQINGKPGEACKGYNGNLNSWFYGISPEYKLKMEQEQNNVGILAQYDTVNSPYYTNVQIDPDYIKFLQSVSMCNKKITN